MLTDLFNAGRTKGSTTMKKMIGVLAVLLFAGAVNAQPAPKGGGGGGDKGGGGGKVKVYDFSGDTIEGDLIKPEGTTVDAIDFAKHSSLIRIRKDFIAEILKSAEDL